MEYRCEATSVSGFVQMLASNYLPHGYWFYVTGRVPEGKAPELIDKKILAKYEIGISRQQRARKKKAGIANLHYLRHGDHFVILATHGKSTFFEHEQKSIRDIRRVPLQFQGYSISVKKGGYLRGQPGEGASQDGRYRVRVLIGREAYNDLSAELLNLANHRVADKLRWTFWNEPYEPYAPIRRQLLKILRDVNTKRVAMGYQRVPTDCIRFRRKIVKPFAQPTSAVRKDFA